MARRRKRKIANHADTPMQLYDGRGDIASLWEYEKVEFDQSFLVLIWIHNFQQSSKPLLDLAALVLSLVNGLMLLRTYLRDRSVLRVRAVHPDVYQWFFRLPGRPHKGAMTRQYGFLAYVGISNRGRRDVCLTSWRLRGRTRHWRRFERVALSIQEPKVRLGSNLKIYPVLGVKGEHFDGETMVKSGASIADFCYYLVEFFGHPFWDIGIKEGKTSADLVVRNVFGQTAKVKITFQEITLEKASCRVPHIADIDFCNADPAIPDQGVDAEDADARDTGEGNEEDNAPRWNSPRESQTRVEI